MASGGLSPIRADRARGWIDAPLDRWVLEQLRRAATVPRCVSPVRVRFRDTLRSGTGEIRSWIVVAGACNGAKAAMVDYIPAHHAVTGLGFAYWNME